MIEVKRYSQEEIWLRRANFHILTYAELGFSPLDIHTRPLRIPRELLEAYVETVNQRGEVKSLAPLAPISAIPKNLVRGRIDLPGIKLQLLRFLSVTNAEIGAKKLLFDLRTPSVPAAVVSAVQAALSSPQGSEIAEAGIIV